LSNLTAETPEKNSLFVGGRTSISGEAGGLYAMRFGFGYSCVEGLVVVMDFVAALVHGN